MIDYEKLQLRRLLRQSIRKYEEALQNLEPGSYRAVVVEAMHEAEQTLERLEMEPSEYKGCDPK